MKKVGSVLLIIVTFACVTTIIVNYYTIKVLSASRAYINGESQYSKGQKDASEYLVSYIYSVNAADYVQFLKAINIPIGDRHAREALSSGITNEKMAQAGFLQAKNHPLDIDDMIWLFKNFQHLGLFENAIKIWTQGDQMVENLRQAGLTAHQQIDAGKLNESEKKRLILNINDISAKLTLKQQAFSDTLGIICRKVNFYVFMVNVVVTLLIIGCIILFVWIALRNMQNSQNKIIEQNNSLQAVNADLDKIVYNVSHDLRSPLASLTGLISLINVEDDMDQVRALCTLMQKSIDKQGQFINEILNSVKNSQSETAKYTCNLPEIIEDVIAQNNYSNDGKKLLYHHEISVQTINCDAIKLKTILNNLVSNAIKYSDHQKNDSWISIKAYNHKSSCIIEVEDNGIGIKNDDKDKIFDKFFSVQHHQNSDGIGLYLTKDAVEQIGGSIKVSSEVGAGTKFVIEIPIGR